MKKLVFIGVLVFVILVQLLIHYRGLYQPPSLGRLDFEGIDVEKALDVDFIDEYVGYTGTVVFDLAHDNDIELRELGVLVSRLTARGLNIEYIIEPDQLGDKLKYAVSYVVISPRVTYSAEEIDLISSFIDKRGRLLLIHDPSRRDSINILSTEFDLVYDTGYLYNQVYNDGNYQYIFLEDFGSSEVTDGLNKISMYAASSISSTGIALGFSDSSTYSSTQPKQRFTPMVITSGGNVLALADLSFMIEPYNSVFDNNKLVSNIADFLGSGRRVYHISDYPYFLGDDYYLVYAEESLLDIALTIKGSVGRQVNFRSRDPGFGNTLIVGTYNSTLTEKYLDSAGITLGDKLDIGGVGKLQKNDSFVISLTQRAGRRVLLVAADDLEGLENAVSYLDTLKDISLTNFVAYSTYEPQDTEEPEEVPTPQEQIASFLLGQSVEASAPIETEISALE